MRRARLLSAVGFDLGVQASLVAHQTIIYGIDPGARSRLNAVLVVGMFTGMVIGSAAGSWLLAAGCWLLAAGCWLLADWGWMGVTVLAASRHPATVQQWRRTLGAAGNRTGLRTGLTFPRWQGGGFVTSAIGRTQRSNAMNDFNVPNLSCGHCVKRVTEALHKADPAAKVDVNLKTKQVHVESTAAADILRRELAEAGYPAQ